MFVHGLVAGIRGIARKFAGVDQRDEIVRHGGVDAGAGEPGGNVLLAHFGGIHVELVGHVAQQRPVKLLIESSVEVLLQEILRLNKTPARYLDRSARLHPHHIGTPGRRSPQKEKGTCRKRTQKEKNHPEHRRTCEESPLRGERRRSRGYEADVRTHVPHVTALHPWHENP